MCKMNCSIEYYKGSNFKLIAKNLIILVSELCYLDVFLYIQKKFM